MQGFESLTLAELRRSALEDFAIEVGPKDSKTLILAALTEGGVTWDDYVAQHPEVAPAPPATPAAAPVAEPVANPGLITAQAQVNAPVDVIPEPAIRFAEAPRYNPNDKLLIKMERENPLFEARGHKFTQKNPYALMSPEDATYVMRNEDGFRQAYPDELAEFYG